MWLNVLSMIALAPWAAPPRPDEEKAVEMLESVIPTTPHHSIGRSFCLRPWWVAP